MTRLPKYFPLWVGISWGLFALWRFGGAFAPTRSVGGYGWAGQLRQAWMVNHRQWREYDYFREPLHGGLVGALGEWLGSYADAAMWVSSLACALIVIGIGFIGKNLAGPIAGGLAAATWPMIPDMVNAVRWGNGYPLATAGMVLALLASLAFLKRSTGRRALGLALAIGLALSLDTRNALYLPIFLACIPISNRGRSRWQAVAFFGCLLALSAPTVLNNYFKSDSRHELTWVDKQAFQQPVVRRWATFTQDKAMQTACKPLDQEVFLTIPFVATDCSRSVLHHNLSHRLPRASPLPIPILSLLLLPLALWSARWRRAALFATVGATAGYVFLMPIPIRYLLPFGVLSTLVAAIGFGALLRRWVPSRLQIVFAAFFLTVVWGYQSVNRSVAIDYKREQAAPEITLELKSHLQKSDVLRDCSGEGLSLALLPLNLSGPMPLRSTSEQAGCLEWLSETDSSNAWALVLERDKSLQEAFLKEGWRSHFVWPKEGIGLWKGN